MSASLFFYPEHVAGEVRMKEQSRLFSFILAVAVCACSSYGAADDILKALRDKPNDKAQLQKLKGALTDIKDQGEKCRCGVIYCLGMLANGDLAEGMAVRAKIAKAYPSDPLLAELSDVNICEPCQGCVSGKAEAECKNCSATGTCAVCGGGGLSKGKGMDGKVLPCAACRGGRKCAACAGTGKVTQPCKACGGKGQMPSKEKCTEIYLRLLK